MVILLPNDNLRELDFKLKSFDLKKIKWNKNPLTYEVSLPRSVLLSSGAGMMVQKRNVKKVIEIIFSESTSVQQ